MLCECAQELKAQLEQRAKAGSQLTQTIKDGEVLCVRVVGACVCMCMCMCVYAYVYVYVYVHVHVLV